MHLPRKVTAATVGTTLQYQISLGSWQEAAFSEEHLELQDSYVQTVLLPTFLSGLCGEEDGKSPDGWGSVHADGFTDDAAPTFRFEKGPFSCVRVH